VLFPGGPGFPFLGEGGGGFPLGCASFPDGGLLFFGPPPGVGGAFGSASPFGVGALGDCLQLVIGYVCSPV
jgi:hypothetical protein